MTNSRDDVIQIIESFFRYQEAFNGNGILSVWHSGGTMYLVGNNNEFRVVPIEEQSEHINQVKDKAPDIQVKFVIDDIERIALHDDLIASVHVCWRMIFPDGYGKHRSFYNMAKVDGTWGIVNVVDRGLEM